MTHHIACQIGHADDFASVVRALRKAQRASQVTEVDHFAIFPKEWVLRGDAGRLVWRKAGIGSSHYEPFALIARIAQALAIAAWIVEASPLRSVMEASEADGTLA